MLGLNGRQAERGVLERMNASIVHRGPDGDGLYLNGAVGLGFRRLSILDLSHAADQPMMSEDGQLILVFNGEIYNYIELRRELMEKGHRFRSTGDSEVLLHSYIEWGTECLSKFNGMWAFVIYDLRRGLLFGSRDRFGVKPLYFYRGRDCVLFGSEIKALLNSGLCRTGPNWKVINAYLLRHGLDESTESFFEGIEQIAPGTAFELDLEGSQKEWRYWSLPDASAETVQDPVSRFTELFEDAVRLRMRSDVPVGVCLSGGLDSTAIICSMARQWGESPQPLHAFTYCAPEFDETPFIADTIEMTRARMNRLDSDPDRAWEILEEVLAFHDEPVHSMSAVIGFELMRLAAARGVKVVLNGNGADEVIGGYSSYFRDYWYTLMTDGRFVEAWGEVGRFSAVHGGNQARLYFSVIRHLLGVTLKQTAIYRVFSGWTHPRNERRYAWFSSEVSEPLVGAGLDGDWALDAVLRQSVERWPLPLYLRLEDRNSMAHSVESRLPFLDYRLVALVFSCASEWKIRAPWYKYLLRESMRRRIPESVRTRVEKWGFPVPQGKWMSTAWYRLLQDLLESQDMRERGIYNLQEIRRDLERHRLGEQDFSDKLFTIVQLELWCRRLKNLALSEG